MPSPLNPLSAVKSAKQNPLSVVELLVPNGHLKLTAPASAGAFMRLVKGSQGCRQRSRQPDRRSSGAFSFCSTGRSGYASGFFTCSFFLLCAIHTTEPRAKK